MPEEVNKCTVINRPEAVALASNKLEFFKAVKDSVNVPEFTVDREGARDWLNNGKKVVVREKLTGHSAEGLVMLNDIAAYDEYDHTRAKMYVLYVPKKDEFRVHVVCGNVIDVRRKALRAGVNKDHANWQVRNYDNGFIFAKEGVQAPDQVLEQSILAVKESGLDFGAVDVIWNNLHEKAFVLEINTAPGLEGSSVDNYAEAFEALYKDEGLSTSMKMNPGKPMSLSQILQAHQAAGPMYQLDDAPAQQDVDHW